MNLMWRFGPDIGELTPEEARKIGELVEHPSWPLFVKYMHIERWATINNGLISAKNSVEFGYCQGDIGRLNKTESDMAAYHAMMQAGSKVEAMQKEDHKVTNSYFADYNEDEDLPLSP